jgi:hypothetical protein
MIERTETAVVLSGERFRIRLSTLPGTTRLVESFELSRAGNGRYDVDLPLRPWTGFAGVTSHTREFFITTEQPQSPGVDVLEDTPARSCVRYGPLYAAAWEVYWTIAVTAVEIEWDVLVRVRRHTVPDDEINLLAFDVPPGEEFVQARFDTGYILPPKEWFAVPEPQVTYRGNDESGGILDRRPRFRFSGDGHETLYLDFAGSYGLSFTCKENNLFRLVPRIVLKPSPPPDPQRLPAARFAFRDGERFAIGPEEWKEGGRVLHAQTQLHACVRIAAHEPRRVEMMHLSTPDETVAERTVHYHRTHALGSIAHRCGFAGGWHNAGLPDGHSVSFEYFMHGKAHFYGLDPAVDAVMANALDSVHQRETHPDGLIWKYGFGGRGAFYESNASMLIFLADYARRTGDLSRLSLGENWADYILDHCSRDPFLYRCPASTGIPGFGRGAYISNWWDVVGCGGYDAFINVLTYPGLRDLALMERASGNTGAADRYTELAERFRRAFNDLFWDDDAGRYLSWVDTEGGRHDYFFTSVNVIAACEGIADEAQRRRLLHAIQARLDELGYQGFSLPGNLVSIPPEHYNAGDWWLEEYGYPHFYDEFGTYENGGIWPWVSAYYIAALAEFDPDAAYDHYLGILDQYARDNLQGAGNGYFWSPATGELTEGSRQEPYLANTAMTIWGFMSLFGLELDFEEGIRIRPRLPQRLDGAGFDLRYHGKPVRFTYSGYGLRVNALHVDGREYDPLAAIHAQALQEGSRVDVRVAP